MTTYDGPDDEHLAYLDAVYRRDRPHLFRLPGMLAERFGLDSKTSWSVVFYWVRSRLGRRVRETRR